MADLTITQLNELTTPLITDVLPIVNTNETKKVTLQSINNNLPITSFVSSNSASWVGGGTGSSELSSSAFIATWTSGYRNMTNNTLNLINFNNVVINTGTDNYELETGNGNTSIDGKIQIKQPGNYLINLLYNTYDITFGSYYSFYIYTNGTSKSTAASHYSTIFENNNCSTGGGQRVMLPSTGVLRVNTAPIWVSLIFRPETGNPYPTDINQGSVAAIPPRVEIIKV